MDRLQLYKLYIFIGGVQLCSELSRGDKKVSESQHGAIFILH